ncbi:uncharacterized protein B0I36DRAFT_341448 [Microdochium trichocladiopsis]|uniref:Uncharacterized protein n=1 Tax=Microdochium trichocladiopsis TaxID=1682393 RepID=A0A9P8XS75_9PEZI|nr:uncharacterized protein B0I36DRAFT_341448 [Microdochium trichocladiopsis]KAH7010881.1 hypothetical protein B0I36DRAFT_341448 [Microdochium trichocladiopsis]
MISAAWAPRADRRPTADQASMELYLTQQHCSRTVMSQFLDARRDWTWCMEGDELCGVCPQHHTDERPVDVELRLPAPPLLYQYPSGSGPQPGSGPRNAWSGSVRTGPMMKWPVRQVPTL